VTGVEKNESKRSTENAELYNNNTNIIVDDTTINTNNNRDDAYSAIIYGKAIARVHSSHLSECGPAPHGWKLVDEAATLSPQARHSHRPIAEKRINNRIHK